MSFQHGLAAFFAVVSLWDTSLLADSPRDQYDVLFFASAGPVVIRVELASTGASVASVRERYAALLFAALDDDKDGQLCDGEAGRLPETGRFVTGAPTLGDRWKELDCAPPDGSLSVQELIAFLDPLLGDRFATRKKPPLLVQSVQLLPRLDRNHDGRISRDEIDRASETLRPFDFDDDGTFSPAELQPFPLSMVESAMSGEEGEAGQFVVLSGLSSMESVAERIVKTFGTPSGAGVPSLKTMLTPTEFEAFDGDRDGHLNVAELVDVLRDPSPSVEITVDLRRGRVTLRSISDTGNWIHEVNSPSRSRLTLQVGEETVEFSAEDNRYQAADQISLLRIEFRRQDGDKNGYLGPQEFAMLGNPGGEFTEVDVNGDNQVTLDELNRFIQLDAYLSQCYAEMVVDAIDKPLFQILDENVDRRLTLKEFARAVERMRPYDLNGDGTLDSRELLALRKYRVSFSFGVPPAVRVTRQGQMTAERRMPVMRPSTSGPRWFQKMDRNQDGDVTWREFLGPRDAFERLDSDGSGWIDADEAEANESRAQVRTGNGEDSPTRGEAEGEATP